MVIFNTKLFYLETMKILPKKQSCETKFKTYLSVKRVMSKEVRMTSPQRCDWRHRHY